MTWVFAFAQRLYSQCFKLRSPALRKDYRTEHKPARSQLFHCHSPKLTVLELLEQLLFHLQQEVVVVLHLLRGVHHECAHQVGAVRLVADPHGTRDGTKVHVVLIAAQRGNDRGSLITGLCSSSCPVDWIYNLWAVLRQHLINPNVFLPDLKQTKCSRAAQYFREYAALFLSLERISTTHLSGC